MNVVNHMPLEVARAAWCWELEKVPMGELAQYNHETCKSYPASGGWQCHICKAGQCKQSPSSSYANKACGRPDQNGADHCDSLGYALNGDSRPGRLDYHGSCNVENAVEIQVDSQGYPEGTSGNQNGDKSDNTVDSNGNQNGNVSDSEWDYPDSCHAASIAASVVVSAAAAAIV